VPILTAQERLGTRLGGRYRVDRLLATGGMSVLFEARDLRAHRSVALKLLRAEDCVEEPRKARFLQEMRLTAELRHAHVVDVLDLGEDDNGIPYLVMELLHGRSLQEELESHGTLGFERTLEILLPVMEALGAVHGAGVVHRDVKPDNIFLHVDPRGNVVPKLLDFGIAKSDHATHSTRTGAVLGTPGYMAPEQVRSGLVGPSADIWALGAVMYRALNGKTPYHAETSAEVIAKLARDPAPALRVPGLALPICAAVDRALAREAADRYADMHAFAEALVLCAREAGFQVAHEPVVPRGPRAARVPAQRTLTAPSRSGEPRRFRQRLPWFAALAALVLLGVVAHFTAREPPRARPPRAQRAESSALDGARAAVATRLTAAPHAHDDAPAVATDRPPIAATVEVASDVGQAASRPEHPGSLAGTTAEQAPKRRLQDVARRRRPQAAAPPPAPPARFTKPSSRSDLPVAVVW
jgi:serine/threonine-protein kinase